MGGRFKNRRSNFVLETVDSFSCKKFHPNIESRMDKRIMRKSQFRLEKHDTLNKVMK